MNWPPERVEQAFAELLSNGFANRCGTTKWVWVIKHLDWNPPENPNQRKAAVKIAASVPVECAWKREFMRVCGPSLGVEQVAEVNPSTTVPQPFPNQEQKQEQEQEHSANAGGEPPTDRDMVFGLGVPLLTEAGTVSDKNARSLLARLSKEHGEAQVRKALEQMAHDRPGEPVSWLQSLLKARPKSAEPDWKRERRSQVAAFAPGIAARPTIEAGAQDVIAITGR
jgi:hypothetical protein